MNNIKQIYIDIDGTLMIDNAVSNENVDALRRAKNLGIKLFVNTGRSKAFVPDCVHEACKWDGFVCGSAYAELEGKVLFSDIVPLPALLGVFEFAESNAFKCNFEGEKEIYGINSKGVKPIDKEQLTSDYSTLRITKVMVKCSPPLSKTVSFDGIHTICFNDYFECICNGYDKSTGMRRISERLNEKRENIAAIGDSINDIAMLEFAGVGFVLPSAPDMGNYIRLTQRETGVAEAIEMIISGNRRSL